VKKKEKMQSSEISDEDTNDIDQNEGTNEEDSEEEELVKAKESKKKKKSKGGSKHQENEKEDLDEGPSRGSLTCAQCNGSFPSKNKLYAHLKDTGHAVFLPKSGVPGGNEGQKKKKKGKK